MTKTPPHSCFHLFSVYCFCLFKMATYFRKSRHTVMETAVLHFLYSLFVIICWCSGNMVQAIELPKYTLILSQSDFQIRLYNESTWISARVSGTSFDQSYKTGFQRFYLFISHFLLIFLCNTCVRVFVFFHPIYTVLFPFQIHFHSNTLASVSSE